MKQTIQKIFILAAILLTTSLSAFALDADFYVDSLGYRYVSKKDATVKVVDCKLEGQWREDGTFTEITIPSTVTYNDTVYTVTRVGANTFDSEFDHRRSIWTVHLPSTIKIIEPYAFRYCQLHEIDIPEGVEQIGDQAFTNNYDLKRVSLPQSLKKLDTQAFYACTALTNIELPNQMDYIADYCFANCTNLISIKMPEHLDYIGNYAFSDCSSLNRIELSEGLTTTNEYTFNECTNLAEVTLPNTLKEIGRYCFFYCHNLQKVHIPESVTRIGRAAFFFCSSLSLINIPHRVTELEQHIFAWTGLKVVDLPENVEEVGIAPFMYCPELLGITFSKNVKSIGEGAVILVPSLQYIRCKSIIPPKLHKDAFDRYDIPLYVPKGCTSLYAADSIWNNFKNVRELEDTDTVTVNYPMSKLTIKDSEKGETVVYVDKGESVTIRLQPSEGKSVKSILLNGVDIIDRLHSNSRLVTPRINDDSTLEIDW